MKAFGMKYLIWLIVLTLSLWAAAWIGALLFLPDWQTRGQFGDMFGSINALFSGLAFVLLIFTIWQQRQELELQREELKLQREEMAASRAELAEQADIQRAQFHATVAQLRAAAIQIRAQINIEEIKNFPFGTGAHLGVQHATHELSNEIERLADGLELQLDKYPPKQGNSK